MIYDYKCWDCDIVIEREYAFGKAAKKIKCSECRKLIEQNFKSPTIHMKGMCHTNMARLRKRESDGLPKEEAQRFYKESIAAGKKRLKTGGHQYASYDFTEEQCANLGGKRLNDSELAKKREINKIQTNEAHRVAKLDPTKKHKQS